MEDGKVVRKILEAAQDGTTPLPVTMSGAATSAKQDTGNASLTSIDSKLTTVLANQAEQTALLESILETLDLIA